MTWGVSDSEGSREPAGASQWRRTRGGSEGGGSEGGGSDGASEGRAEIGIDMRIVRRGIAIPVASCSAEVRTLATSVPHWAMARCAAHVRSWHKA